MTDVTVTPTIVNVVATQDAATINVTSSTTGITAGTGTVRINDMTRYRYPGNTFSGADGTIGRSLVHVKTISDNALVTVGGKPLDTTEFSLSTTTVANDTITIVGYIFDSDVMLLWD
jgi:hypothetical protein